LLVDRWLEAPDTLDKASLLVVEEIIEEWRERLCSLSWFMRGVNEKIARMANEEEGTKGRFWESRFRSQALLDEAALLSCMAYVDLNPVRAAMAEELCDSDFTSIQQRLYDYVKYKAVKSSTERKLTKRIQQQKQLKSDLALDKQPESPLMTFDGSSHTDIHFALPFTREDYFDLVDKTGRIIREDKRGFIATEIPTLISRLGIDADQWATHIRDFGRRYANCVGSADNIVNFAEQFDRCWGKGVSCSLRLYRSAYQV